MTNTDEELSREEEFLKLFAKSQRGIHAYILALVFEPNTAADLLQETNIVLWRKFEHYELGTSFFSWAREVARLTVLRHRRTSARNIVTLDPHLLEELAGRFSEKSESIDTKNDILNNCLEKLRMNDRELIVSRYQPGAAVSGIAARLGRSENSISQSLCRIRRTLTVCVEKALSAEEHLPQG